MALAAQSVFRGTDAEVWIEGVWITNITEVDANVAIDQVEISVLGNYWANYRNMGLKGSGSTKGLFVNTDLIEKLSAIQNGQEYRTEIVMVNTNPDTGVTYRVQLQNVLFSTIPLGTFQAGQLAAQDMNFTFSGFEILDPVPAS